MYIKKYIQILSIFSALFFTTACSNDAPGEDTGNSQNRTVKAQPSAFTVEGAASSLPGEDEINDMQACLFENGILTEVYTQFSKENTDGTDKEEYTVVRRNWGLPVTYLNGVWWCKYNAMGDSKNFSDQILSSNDPAAKAGKTLFDYLRDCTPEEFFKLWKWQYQGKTTQGLEVIDVGVY